MEVASPLNFTPMSSGAKRSLSCSPSYSDTNGMDAEDHDMLTARRDVRSDHTTSRQQLFKRRRFDSNESATVAAFGSVLAQPLNASSPLTSILNQSGSSFALSKGEWGTLRSFVYFCLSELLKA
jgi:hypothetical protein